MTGEGIIVVGVLVGIVVLFVSEKYPLDIVAMLGLGVLLVLGLVTLQEGLSGFSNPATLTVGSMFVLGAGLQKTGATATVGRLMVRFSRNHYEVGALPFNGYEIRWPAANLIDVAITHHEVADPFVACTADYPVIETIVPLGSDFEPDERYTVSVNREAALSFRPIVPGSP